MSPQTSLPRRRFLGQGALALALGSTLLSGADASSNRRRVAIIGHTGRGDYGHGLDEIFLSRPALELVAIADADPTGLERAASKLHPARRYANYREMLDRERPQLVSVAPRQADQHHDMVMAALNAGAHVYCEKPFSISPLESDEMLATANRLGKRIAVAHQMRLTPPVVRLAAAVKEGLIGELVEMRGHGKQDARSGGEDLMVLGTHLFDLMRLFAGDPESCTARILWKGKHITRADARQVKDNVGPVAGDEIDAQFEFPRGVHATFTSRARLAGTVGNWGLELIGSKGVARINANIPPWVFVRESSGWGPNGRSDQWRPFAPDPEPAAGVSPFALANARVVEDWLRSIDENREPACSGRNGAWAVEMAMATYHAALTNRRVRFPLEDRRHPLAG